MLIVKNTFCKDKSKLILWEVELQSKNLKELTVELSRDVNNVVLIRHYTKNSPRQKIENDVVVEEARIRRGRQTKTQFIVMHGHQKTYRKIQTVRHIYQKLTF